MSNVAGNMYLFVFVFLFSFVQKEPLLLSRVSRLSSLFKELFSQVWSDL